MQKIIWDSLLFMWFLPGVYLDIKKKKIPWIWLGVGIVFSVGYQVFVGKQWGLALSGMAIGGLLIFLSCITKEGIGIGDGLVFVITGMYYGIWDNITLLVISLTISSLWSIGLLILKKVKKNYKIPFIPFVACSCVFLILTGV